MLHLTASSSTCRNVVYALKRLYARWYRLACEFCWDSAFARPLSTATRCSTSAQIYALMTPSLKRSAVRGSAGFNRVTGIMEPSSTNPLFPINKLPFPGVEGNVLTAMARLLRTHSVDGPSNARLKALYLLQICLKPNRPYTRPFKSATILLGNKILCCSCSVCVCLSWWMYRGSSMNRVLRAH